MEFIILNSIVGVIPLDGGESVIILRSFHRYARANTIASLSSGRLEEFSLAHWVDRLCMFLFLFPVVQKRRKHRPISVKLGVLP